MKQLVATYPDLDAARSAMESLERHGIDAVDMELVDRPPLSHRPEQVRTDRAVNHRYGRRALAGAVPGAVLFGALALVAALVFSDARAGLVLGAALAAAGVGGAIGAFYGIATRLPANPETFDTYADDRADAGAPVHVAVRIDGHDAGSLRDVLQRSGAREVDEA